MSINKSKKLIKEGYSNIQNNFTDAMLNLKRENPDLVHKEVIDLLKSEFDRFVKLHTEKMEFPKLRGTKFVDKMPFRPIPYGSKNKKKGL